MMGNDEFIEAIKAFAPYVASGLVFAGVIVASWFTYKAARKASRDTIAITERKDTIADRDGLIVTLTNRLDKIEARLTVSESEIEALKGRNGELSLFGNALVRILDDNGLTHLVPQPVPPGIYVYIQSVKPQTDTDAP
jgi:hypothetical protein